MVNSHSKVTLYERNYVEKQSNLQYEKIINRK